MTSGSVNFTVNALDIVTDAMYQIEALGANDTLDSTDLDFCMRRLNMMVKAWMAMGAKLWALDEATLFLSVGTQSYSLGSIGDNCTNTYVHTTLSTAEALGSTSLGITSATGMSASDKIGIVLDDGTVHWTTISGAPGTTTTIALGLAGAASAGNVVFAYTTKINRPQRIISAYRRDINDADTPITLLAREDYANLSSKLTEGKTIQAFYDPQLTTGVFSVWPTADSATDVIRFWYERVLEDFDASTDAPDFPIEWAEPLVAGLAYRIGPAFGIGGQQLAILKADADEKLDIAMGYDRETASVIFQPNIR